VNRVVEGQGQELSLYRTCYVLCWKVISVKLVS